MNRAAPTGIGKIGIVALSSVIPKIEFEIGSKFLSEKGFQIEVHPTTFDQYYFYPASDENRARAFMDYANRDDLQAIWCARGGYGITHLLPLIEKASRNKKPPKKTLLGFSDVTALHEFVRTRWGWNTIHAPMPSLRTFSCLRPPEWNSLMDKLEHVLSKKPLRAHHFSLKPIYAPKEFKAVTAPVVGGNLSVWNALLGTPYVGNARGKILFLEDVGENISRINRMVHHLEQAGGLKGVKAVVLGDFTDCQDLAPRVLQVPPPKNDTDKFLKNPPPEALGVLRDLYSASKALEFVFRGLGERNKIPVYQGLPVGHGSNQHSIFLGKKHELKSNGSWIEIE